MLEIIIDNRDGTMWDISGIVSELTYKTSRTGKASSLDLTFVQDGIYQSKAFKYNSGDVIRVRQGGVGIFYGYIFEIESGKGEEVSLTAYDQLRYLMANDSYVFRDVTVADIIRRIADDFGMKIGTLENTGHIIPQMIEDNRKLMDIICKGLDLTLIATLRNYVFYDDYGELALRDIRNRTLDFTLGEASLLYDYKQKRSIDNSYNRIKIVQDNKQEGHRDVYIHQDSANIAKWGRLQLYQVADEKQNPAQIVQSLENQLRWYNRESKSLKIDAIGDIRARAGCYLPLHVERLGLNQYFLINECTHKYSGADHTMSLDLVDIRIGDERI
ncbi:hypothetical protein ACFFNY_21830 [Paenibacillus hodogayensis]|uniref:YqbQ/XkdQ domain-containing protein n=1 Tax=Paenibacillus hodogayensis TaxID=279208 RepID=A0ABV5W0X6_9BACL